MISFDLEMVEDLVFGSNFLVKDYILIAKKDANSLYSILNSTIFSRVARNGDMAVSFMFGFGHFCFCWFKRKSQLIETVRRSDVLELPFFWGGGKQIFVDC